MTKFAIFTGAGCSQESGIPTFRDAAGLWEQYSPADVCSIWTYESKIEKINEFYSMLKRKYSSAQPNEMHFFIAELQKQYPDDVAIFTSNVDMLLEAAGCVNVCHVHGDMMHVNCPNCGNRIHIGMDDFTFTTCPKCSHTMKPGVVFFGESAPKYADLDHAFTPMDENGYPSMTHRLIIGTSFEVISAQRLGVGSYGSTVVVDPNANFSHYHNTTTIQSTAVAAVPHLRNHINTNIIPLLSRRAVRV